MDALIGLGHFCETHGPCVILCTQRSKEPPEDPPPHTVTAPWCESCRSMDSDQAFVCRDDHTCYVTTRTPLKQHLAFLLKQATVRSLSCEQEDPGKDGGIIYFGDNERGHVISHMFTVQDSLARGFHRRYTIVILMKDKLHLLNNWPLISNSFKEISSDLQKKAAHINDIEQAHKSQRSVRQSHNSPSSNARSLPQLTGEPAVFAHLHLWFTWLISVETFVEKPYKVPPSPVECKPEALRNLAKEMNETVFRKIAYCILTSIKVEADPEIINAFKQLLPKDFALPETGNACKVTHEDGEWKVHWSGQLPQKLPTLLTMAEEALKNDKMSLRVLEPYLESLLMQWYNNACCMKWTPSQNKELLQALGIQKFDLPLVTYWMTQVK